MARVAVVTGASAGIGAATGVALADAGFDVVLGARRIERVEEVAQRCGGRAMQLDVTDPDSVATLVRAVDQVDLLVNNAGMAVGRDELADTSDDAMRRMWDVNLLGVVRMTRELLPKLRRSQGHVINVGSIAGIGVYRGGGGYTSTKHALRAITKTLRLELLGTGVRVSEVAPGAVETEFSNVRFAGDEAKAAQVYEGFDPLTAEDVADAIAWVATRPPHVNVEFLVVHPTAQADGRTIHRG